jgi:hypothetical protein
LAYVGFGQNLTITPLLISQAAAAIANGGWIAPPHLWLGDWEAQRPPTSISAAISRPPIQRLLDANDAKVIEEAMRAVTTRGTASTPFAKLNRQCLAPYGLQIIGKTGTAETRSARARKLLLDQAKAAQTPYKGSRAAWIKESGCHKRRSWSFDYPEEGIADSLFVGAIVHTTHPPTQSLPTRLSIPLADLAFAFVVQHGYHPEGQPCQQKGRDLDHTEARYLAHDTLLAILQHAGLCRDLSPLLPP